MTVCVYRYIHTTALVISLFRLMHKMRARWDSSVGIVNMIPTEDLWLDSYQEREIFCFRLDFGAHL